MPRPRPKIALFEDDSIAEAPIAVPSRGSSLLARTVSTTLDRDMLEQVIVDGFFARTSIDDLPRESRRVALQEFGLPYASDPVVSKHLARFLTRSLQNVKASETLAALVGASVREQTCSRPPRSFQWRCFQGRAHPQPCA